jgi:hypothetical protein
LANPRNAQTLLETRLTGASNGRNSIGLDLDLNVACSPHEFECEWRLLPQGALLTHRVLIVPFLSDCHKHFSARRFFVVGSGLVGGNVSRVLVIAQADSSRCLVEIKFNSDRHEMKAEIWCGDQDRIRFFLSEIGLKELFGDLS